MESGNFVCGGAGSRKFLAFCALDWGDKKGYLKHKVAIKRKTQIEILRRTSNI